MKLGRIMAKRREEAGATAHVGEPSVRERQRERQRKRPRTSALAANRAFVPLVGTWGLALGGLAVLVMPFSATARIALLTGLDARGGTAHYMVAALAALAGGALAFGIARELSVRARRDRGGPSIVSKTRLRPIRPTEDLGSPSFDAPLDTLPLGAHRSDWTDPAGGAEENDAEEDAQAAPGPANEASEQGADAIRRRLARALDEAEAARDPVADEGSAQIAAEEESPGEGRGEEGLAGKWSQDNHVAADLTILRSLEKPFELDLAEFGRLPGRNAVWVEGPLPGDPPADPDDRGKRDAEPMPAAPQKQPSSPSLARSSAIARLRATPTEDLSLVQLVERLAAALHERQAAEDARPHGALDGDSEGDASAGRDAALAEAIRALGELAGAKSSRHGGHPGGGSASGEVRELAAALARLHDMRGAA